MARHLLSFLGTFPYKETNYQYGKDTHQSRYVLDALLHTACKGWGQGDKVTVFVTQQAREKNWEDHTIKNPETEESEFQEGLKSVLEKMYSEIKPEDKPDIKAADIPDGNTESEIWELFAKMNDEIEEGDELYIDITNSFREIPLLMTATAIFARSVKQAKVQAIYYGAFVPGSTDDTQIINLVKFVDIIDWSVATQLFVKHGNVDMIGTLYESVGSSEDSKSSNLADMLSYLQEMVQGLDNSQGNITRKEPKKKGGNQKNTVLDSYKNYEERYLTYCDSEVQEGYDSDSAIREVTKVIYEDIKRFAPIDDMTETEKRYSSLVFGMQAVKWYIQKGKVQTGFTAIDETMKTYICNRYHLDETSYSNREEGSRFCQLLSKLDEKDSEEKKREKRRGAIDRWKAENPHPCLMKRSKEQTKRLKEYFREHPEEKKNYKLLFKNGNPEAISNGISTEFVKLKLKVSNSRNSMNHFGFTKQKMKDDSDSMSDLKKYYNELKEILLTELKTEFRPEILENLKEKWSLDEEDVNKEADNA